MRYGMRTQYIRYQLLKELSEIVIPCKRAEKERRRQEMKGREWFVGGLNKY